MLPCPVPGCADELTSKTSAFCPGHHFMLPPRVVRQIVSLKCICVRSEDEEMRKHLLEQIDAHVSLAVRQLTEMRHAG